MRLLILKPFYMNFTKILNNSNVVIIGGEKSGKLLAEKFIFENFYPAIGFPEIENLLCPDIDYAPDVAQFHFRQG